MAKQKQNRKYTAEEKAARRLQHDTSLFKVQQEKDADGICIPPYEPYTSNLREKAPARDILNNPANASKVYTVQDAFGNPHSISLEWFAGFVDGEGTVTIYLNRNDSMTLGFQIQAAFVVVQGVSDYALLTAIANFLGMGTVDVNKTDKTSTRYQIRIVNTSDLVSIIIPLFKLVNLRTKKKDEFIIWADLTQQLDTKSINKDWPNNMLKFIDNLRALKHVGIATDQALDYLSTCNDLEANVKQSKNPPK